MIGSKPNSNSRVPVCDTLSVSGCFQDFLSLVFSSFTRTCGFLCIYPAWGSRSFLDLYTRVLYPIWLHPYFLVLVSLSLLWCLSLLPGNCLRCCLFIFSAFLSVLQIGRFPLVRACSPFNKAAVGDRREPRAWPATRSVLRRLTVHAGPRRAC